MNSQEQQSKDLKQFFSLRAIAGVVLLGMFPPFFILLSNQLSSGSVAVNKELCFDLAQGLLFSITVTMFLFYGTVFIIHLLHSKIPWHRNTFKRLVTELVLVTGYAFAGMYLISWLFSRFVFGIDNFRDHLFQNEVLAITISLMVTMFMEAKYFLSEWKTALIRSEQMKREITESQYEALKNQVNPHFLFNSLNSLTALVHKDPDKAVEFISEFSKIYRYVLDTSSKVVVELSRELDFLQSYFFLQKIRFGENLKVEINIPSEKLHSFVPPLSLQLLAENAIKHNEISSAKPLHIFISTEENFLVMKNDLQRRDEPVDSTGIGLQNLQSRYEAISDVHPEFSAKGKYFIARIPIIES
jgi:two-component system, LytTR family, sensor kinase